MDKVTGRAICPTESDGMLRLPAGVKFVEQYRDVPRGVSYWIFEGDSLPIWVRGRDPWMFNSYQELIDYTRGNHMLTGG